VRAIAEIAQEHSVLVTHGNGPQIGLLALQAEAYRESRAFPLDVLGAESEGMIGYVIEQELINCLPGRPVATLLTQICVDSEDPAFRRPSKPIGPVYPEEQAKRLESLTGWKMGRDGEGFRRLIASPEPVRIVEFSTIELLIDADVIVICLGGGGIPVVETSYGALVGVEAVIDKDLAAALLATELGADALLLLTDVDAVYADWGTPEASPLRVCTPEQLAIRSFEPGSMGPKVEAACRFVQATGGVAGIGCLEDASAILSREKGTIVST
jgi:carbamate kinase